MASEKAKELARQQKAAIKAEKQRKKNSSDPRDWGQWRQIREMYKLTTSENPRFPWILASGFAGPVVVFTVVGLFVSPLVLWIMLGITAGLVVALLLFNREIKRATFSRVQGQAGSAQVALEMLPKGWSSTPAINANRELDVIHRAVGPCGVVLVGEGNPRRVRQMLANESKRHASAGHNVNIITIVMGEGEGEVPLTKLTDHIRKLPKTYDKAQVDDIARRVRALDAVRPRLGGVPKGPMNVRGARKALRGR